MSTEPQKEWFEKDYYKALGVSDKASAKDITKAYRKLARDFHPDANPGDEKAEERFKEISSAYDVIGDEEKRKSYDEVRRMGPMAGGFGGGPGPGGFNVGFDDIGDLLGGLFGRGGRGGRGGPQEQTRGQPGSDLEAELTLDFDDAVTGLETTITLTSEATCSTCSGGGSKPGSTPEPCGVCHGKGVQDENQGLFSFSRPCAACSGRGSIITDPCRSCGGIGVEVRPRDVKVRIPAGVKTGQKIRLNGRGGPGRLGGPPGDLFVRINVADHPLFGRNGKDLTIDVPITFSEAALGAKVKVPTLEGEPVTIKIPPGTSTGKTFRLRGKGGGGDVLATVVVAVPSNLTAEQRAAVEALAQATHESPRAHLGV
ncbi:MAG: molecular chaperone DnaJ [Acidimicrobiales bacterium]|nr:molecular chaperone DnaJ [Acidimicrobiales bacterium]